MTVDISMHRRVRNGEGKAQKRANEDEDFTNSELLLNFWNIAYMD